MKKSEMLEMMEIYFILTDMPKRTPKESAELLLEAMVNRGMLPPCECTEHEYGPDCTSFDHYNCWEKEDE